MVKVVFKLILLLSLKLKEFDRDFVMVVFFFIELKLLLFGGFCRIIMGNFICLFLLILMIMLLFGSGEELIIIIGMVCLVSKFFWLEKYCMFIFFWYGEIRFGVFLINLCCLKLLVDGWKESVLREFLSVVLLLIIR